MNSPLLVSGRALLLVLVAGACEPLDEPRDVRGTFEVTYDDNLRI